MAFSLSWGQGDLGPLLIVLPKASLAVEGRTQKGCEGEGSPAPVSTAHLLLVSSGRSLFMAPPNELFHHPKP